MTEEEKHKAAIAAKDKEIADLQADLAKAKESKAKAPAPEPEEDLTPTPTQEELNAIRSGEYLTRQSKAG